MRVSPIVLRTRKSQQSYNCVYEQRTARLQATTRATRRLLSSRSRAFHRVAAVRTSNRAVGMELICGSGELHTSKNISAIHRLVPPYLELVAFRV